MLANRQLMRNIWRNPPFRAVSPLYVRSISVARPARQYEALGVLVDAADKAKEEIDRAESESAHLKRGRRIKRKNSGNGNGNDGNGGNNGGKNGNDSSSGTSGGKKESKWKQRARSTFIKAAETAVIMTSGLAMLGFAGVLYHRTYNLHALHKMEDAFNTWDPVLKMSSHHKKLGDDEDWVERPQQHLIDDIVSGEMNGRYWVLLGEKGTGKTSMLLHAIQHVEGKNVVVMDAHPDSEIFRQRLGKALNFEFHEDYWGGLFSLRGPRENTFLDIERVFNVLEEVAVRRFKRLGKPLCVVINNAHLIPEDEDGMKMLSLLQQKAESFSGSGIANIVFNSDDYWLYQRMSHRQTRMDAISVSDLSKPESFRVLKRLRRIITGEETSDALCNTVYWLVGGRPQHLAAVAGHKDMVAASQKLIDREKQWFLNCCGLLGSDMDDDVMDSGKFATSGMLLAREFVRMDDASQEQDPTDGSQELPRIPLWRARQVMTRPDFIREYDNLNLFTLDAASRVKPDSVVMMHAFREIVNIPGFEDLLESTIERVSEIESLQRTRELTFKDLGGGGSKTKGKLVLKDGNKIELEMPEDNFGDEGSDNEQSNSEGLMLDSGDRHFWKKRISALPK